MASSSMFSLPGQISFLGDNSIFISKGALLRQRILDRFQEAREAAEQLKTHPKVAEAWFKILDSYEYTIDVFEPQVRTALKQLQGTYKFFSQLVLHPRKIGAICPSGQELCTKMAALVPEDNGLVVEFGAGTGAVTQAMIQRGIDPKRLVVIEYVPEFCKVLRKKFPEVTVVEGDAARFGSYLPEGAKVSAIVSSLPLINLPPKTRSEIMGQIRKHLSATGCIIQYTYALWGYSPFSSAGYAMDTRSIVLRNLPPARLERYRPVARMQKLR